MMKQMYANDDNQRNQSDTMDKNELQGQEPYQQHTL